MEGYKIINSFIRPAYSYIDGDEHEDYWVDSQNCWYYIICEETDEKTGKRLDNKKYWIIEPFIPVNLVITEDNYEEIKCQIKWLVTVTSEKSDKQKEWDFINHCIKK